MQKIENNKITLTKGDTLRATVTIKNPDGTEYIPTGGDEVRFAMKDANDTEGGALVIKVIPNDTQMLWLEPDDTKNLAVGDYMYDLQLTKENGDVDTFIDRGVMRLTEEVC